MVGTKKVKKIVNTEKNKKGFEELIIIETNEVEKAKKLLDEGHVNYKVYNDAIQQSKKAEFLSRLAKLSPQERKEIQETKKAMSSLKKARIKY